MDQAAEIPHVTMAGLRQYLQGGKSVLFSAGLDCLKMAGGLLCAVLTTLIIGL